MVVVQGVDTIDASMVHTDFLSHSYYGNSIISDISAIIGRELPPAQRGHRERPSTDGIYWEYLLPQLKTAELAEYSDRSCGA